MKLLAKSEYACLAMSCLAQNYEKKWVSIDAISKEFDISQKFLEQILLTLKKAGYLKSARGASGGYMFSKPPSEVSVAEVIRTISGPIAPVLSASKYFYQETPLEQNQKLISLFKDIRDYTAWKLENTFFSDLI